MDIEIMKQLIKKYEPSHAAFVTRAAVAERYYRNETDILFRDKPKEDKEESDNPLRLRQSPEGKLQGLSLALVPRNGHRSPAGYSAPGKT